MRKNAIIVGMARSGTSLTAAIFAKKGYFVSDNPEQQFQAGNTRNPGGYWELNALKDANAEILARAGFGFHNTWTAERIDKQQAEAIRSLTHSEEHKNLVRRFNAENPWMLKDPRFCYTLGYWWPLMDASTTGVVLVTRNPAHIRRSLIRTGWGSADYSDKRAYIERINEHVEFARQTIGELEIPHIEIDYGDFALRPEYVAASLGEFFGIQLSIDDLGYESRYNTATPRGQLAFAAERLSGWLPKPVRKIISRLVPKSLIGALIPGRSVADRNHRH